MDPAVVAAHYKCLFGQRITGKKENKNQSRSADATAYQNNILLYPAAYYLAADSAMCNVVNAAGGCGGGTMIG
jgi:hypothetical protein